MMIQGPLAGISCAPFRRLVWQHSQPAFTCTEMISCKTLVQHSTTKMRRYIYKDPAEGPVCFQLSASDSNELAEAVKRATDYGADLIDLNCGCPVNKIRRKNAGSKHLSAPGRLYQLIKAMKQNTHLPVSIKIRVDGASADQWNATIAQVVAEAGVDFLVVHGRHWTEHYETACHYDDIQFFVDTLKIPVIGNGDVACLSSLQRMLATGCQGVMISRATVGRPWLMAALKAALQGSEYVLPSVHKRRNMLINHIENLIELLQNESLALLEARQFAKYYAFDLREKNDFLQAINQCVEWAVARTIIEHFFE